MKQLTLLQGRLCIVTAAGLWSLSGAFVKLLRPPTGEGAVPGLTVLGLGDPHALGLGDPPVPPLVMACFRGLCAGLAFLPALRRSDVTFRPLMLAMMLVYAVMNALFISAMGLGSAANAIFLQYTAPLWMFLISIFWLKEPADRRSLIALLVAMCGTGVIVGGAWSEGSLGDLLTVLIALGSGLTFAVLLVFIRILRDVSPRWITVQNNLAAGLVLLPFLFTQTFPTWPQLIVLFIFGSVQLALPYLLVARGLKVVSPQEAGTILLLEPLLNPVWAYLVAGDVPERWTVYGGVLILAALAWRYWPRRSGGRDTKR